MSESLHISTNEGDLLKTCTECGVEKLLTAFHKKTHSQDGRYNECKECRRPKVRAITLMKTFGMTIEEYDIILAQQNGRCMICKTKRAFSNGGKFCVDHNWQCCGGGHGCEECIRGLLCQNCNTRLGWLETFWENIMDYLEHRPLRDLRALVSS